MALASLGFAAHGSAQDKSEAGEITVGQSVRNDTSPPLRDIPVAPMLLQPGHLEREPLGFPKVFQSLPDPVVESSLAPAAMPAPILNFDGIPYPGCGGLCLRPNTSGEAGATQYVQTAARSLQVFDKATGASVLGPVEIVTLWAGFGGVCETDPWAQPVMLYDQLADRWVVSQLAGVSSLPTDECVAVSTTGDATGAWFRYDFNLGVASATVRLHDPQLSVWPDAYYLRTWLFDASGGSLYYLGTQPFALNRAAMLTGAPASFITPGRQAPNQAFLPADLDGSTPPPAGAPNPWVNAYMYGESWSLYRFHVDWTTPANSTFALAGNLPWAPYSQLYVDVPQLGTPVLLSTWPDRPMFRLAYRRFADDHEALVGNVTVSSGGVAAIRWWEIGNATSGTPAFVQQGTYQPDSTWRWLGSAAMDFVGNLAVGFSASSASIYPQIRYAGRLAGDQLGQLAQGEATLFAGSGSSTSGYWGRFSDLTVDPVDDCTFWYTNEYYATTSYYDWRTRIGSFKFPDCSLDPTFMLGVAPASLGVCTPLDGTYTVTVTSVQGFTQPVTLSATGHPAGSTVGFSTNPVTPTGSSTLTIGNTGGAAAGRYTIHVEGQSAPKTLVRDVTLDLFAVGPGATTLTAPAYGALNQPLSPTFTWSAATQAATYTLEVATDAAFTNIVHSAAGLTSTTHDGATLEGSTVYFWRVRAVNACGSGSTSTASTFTTQVAPGGCPIGVVANTLYSEGFESGAAGWAHSGTGDTWALSTANPHSGTQSFFAADPAWVSDQRLVSPPIVIPPGHPPVVMSFWNWQLMETGQAACLDGGILEISTDGGTTWTQVPDASLLTDPYDDPIATGYANPLEGLNAWCGNNPQPYLNSIVDITSYAGQTVQFRFRLGSNYSYSRPGWHIDDVVVQNCPSDLIFKDGFQTP